MGIYEKVNTKTIMKKCEQLWRLIMKNYKCTVCGYTYKPERGDKLNDIPPNKRIHRFLGNVCTMLIIFAFLDVFYSSEDN